MVVPRNIPAGARCGMVSASCARTNDRLAQESIPWGDFQTNRVFGCIRRMNSQTQMGFGLYTPYGQPTQVGF